MSQKASLASDTFSAAYARILEATGCAGQEDLAKKLGVRQSYITDCRRRGEFTSEVLLALVEHCNLNPHWVRTGHEMKYLKGTSHLSAEELTKGEKDRLVFSVFVAIAFLLVIFIYYFKEM